MKQRDAVQTSATSDRRGSTTRCREGQRTGSRGGEHNKVEEGRTPAVQLNDTYVTTVVAVTSHQIDIAHQVT